MRSHKMAAKENTNPNKTARIAGLLYLSMVPLGFFGYSYIPTFLIISGDAASTVNNIIIHEWLFRLSIVCALTVQVVNILLVLVLYKLLNVVNKNYALLMVVFLLVGTPIAMFNQVNLFSVLHILNSANFLSATKVGQLHNQVMLSLDVFRYGAQIAAIFFGLWLLPMAYLVFKSSFLPKLLGVLLIIGGVGYLIDSFTIFLFPDFKGIVLFTFWGEILFPLWLLIKGVNIEQWEKCSLESS